MLLICKAGQTTAQRCAQGNNKLLTCTKTARRTRVLSPPQSLPAWQHWTERWEKPGSRQSNTCRLPNLVEGVLSDDMDSVVDVCCRDAARVDAGFEPHEVDMVSAWEVGLLSVDMGLLGPS